MPVGAGQRDNTIHRAYGFASATLLDYLPVAPPGRLLVSWAALSSGPPLNNDSAFSIVIVIFNPVIPNF